MREFNDLVGIIKRLTAKDGCPWDKVQTHESIRANMIEEAYEAVDAIDKHNKDAMIEELGDLLLQVVLHADIASRLNSFDINDIIERLCEKLISRHSHIFGTKRASNVNEALSNWENEKAKEKNYQSVADQLQKLPKGFPSLLRAQKIIKKSGYRAKSQVSAEDAGEYLFNACATVAQSGLDAEVALNTFNNKFVEELSKERT